MKRTAAYQVGDTGRIVAENIRTLRTVRKLSRRALAELCIAVRPVFSEGAIYAIERGDRRIDVDDLVMFAHIYHTDPATLLSPICDACHATPQSGFTCNACGVGSPC